MSLSHIVSSVGKNLNDNNIESMVELIEKLIELGESLEIEEVKNKIDDCCSSKSCRNNS